VSSAQARLDKLAGADDCAAARAAVASSQAGLDKLSVIVLLLALLKLRRATGARGAMGGQTAIAEQIVQ
jgi:hypothetical protein